MQTLSQIKAALEARGLRPSRALGQNFLVDHHQLRGLVDTSGVGTGSLVLEVGPGTGALTDELLARGASVVAVELDRGLADLLRERYAGADRFTLVEGDALDGPNDVIAGAQDAIAGRGFVLVANLPYGAASRLMATLATRFHPMLAPSRGLAPCLGQFVTIQKEVAQRLRAAPGTRDFGELGAVVQAMAIVSRVSTLSPGCFWPQPKVTSEMVSITPRAEPFTRRPESLMALCRALFTQRRKQLGTSVARAFPEAGAGALGGVDPSRRPEQLSVDELVELADRLVNAGERSAG